MDTRMDGLGIFEQKPCAYVRTVWTTRTFGVHTKMSHGHRMDTRMDTVWTPYGRHKVHMASTRVDTGIFQPHVHVVSVRKCPMDTVWTPVWTPYGHPYGHRMDGRMDTVRTPYGRPYGHRMDTRMDTVWT